MLRSTASRGLAAALLIACGSAGASGLQVAPVGLEFAPTSRAQGLWLTDTGDEPLHAQVRVFHWTQANGKDVLAPTTALVASPPMLNLAPGAQQLVRVIHIGSPSTGPLEDAYRVLVDELPQPQQQRSTSVHYILRYSVPVFVEPANSTDAGTVATALHWALIPEGNSLVLEVRNGGTQHAQLSNTALVMPGGKIITLSSGLLGYALPGSTMRWPLKVPATQFGSGTLLKVTVNGKPVEQPIANGNLPG